MSSAVTRARISGSTYIAASVGFLVVFMWLAKHFGYPDVLDLSADQVLPQLRELGGAGRTVWVVYAILPLLLIPAITGASSLLQQADPRGRNAVRTAVVLQMLAAVFMTIGLARWSTIQWALAAEWGNATAARQLEITATFNALNLYLGNVIGEFAGEIALYGSFVALAVTLYRSGSRWLATLAAITAAFGLVGMFRNITPVVDPASAVTNSLLPIFLIAFGLKLVRMKGA